MKNTRKLVMSGLCAALGLVLPLAFHAVPNAGQVFLPMHIPVLLCGLITGPAYGLVCGAVTPLLSSLLTGMPPSGMLPGMMCELATYGLAGGALALACRRLPRAAGVYVALVGAMLAGRLVSGAVNALIFRAGSYTLEAWLAASFVTALPGIAIQLVAIPLLVAALERAHVIAPVAARREA